MCFIVLLTGRTDMNMLLKENTFNILPCPMTPRSRHHLYIHLVIGLYCCYRITMSLKCLKASSRLVQKNDVKQQITTITFSSSL